MLAVSHSPYLRCLLLTRFLHSGIFFVLGTGWLAALVTSCAALRSCRILLQMNFKVSHVCFLRCNLKFLTIAILTQVASMVIMIPSFFLWHLRCQDCLYGIYDANCI